jgi:hypothetical protein
VNKPGREEYLIRKYKIKDDKPSNLVNLYFRNHPIVSDFGKIEDEGSIGGVVTVVIRDDSKERRGDNPPDINLVTLINDRSTRMYKRHLSEGSAVISWDEFEALKNKVSPQTKPDILSKSDVGIERIKEKREKSQKRYVNFLRVIANDGQSANELESYFNQYYDMMDDLNNTSNENIKKKTSEISSLRFKIFNLIDTTNRRTQNKTYEQKKGDVEKIMNAFDPKSWKTELQTYFTNTWEKFWK